jgi:hypothetical protein
MSCLFYARPPGNPNWRCVFLVVSNIGHEEERNPGLREQRRKFSNLNFAFNFWNHKQHGSTWNKHLLLKEKYKFLSLRSSAWKDCLTRFWLDWLEKQASIALQWTWRINTSKLKFLWRVETKNRLWTGANYGNLQNYQPPLYEEWVTSLCSTPDVHVSECRAQRNIQEKTRDYNGPGSKDDLVRDRDLTIFNPAFVLEF